MTTRSFLSVAIGALVGVLSLSNQPAGASPSEEINWHRNDEVRNEGEKGYSPFFMGVRVCISRLVPLDGTLLCASFSIEDRQTDIWLFKGGTPVFLRSCDGLGRQVGPEDRQTMIINQQFRSRKRNTATWPMLLDPPPAATFVSAEGLGLLTTEIRIPRR